MYLSYSDKLLIRNSTGYYTLRLLKWVNMRMYPSEVLKAPQRSNVNHNTENDEFIYKCSYLKENNTGVRFCWDKLTTFRTGVHNINW